MTEYWEKRWKEARACNQHPWNQKSKELLQMLPDDAVEYESQEPYNQPDPNQLYCLQLMDWGLKNLEEFQPVLPREIIPMHGLFNLLQTLRVEATPKGAMEFLTETPWDPESDPFPTVEAFRKVETPEEGAYLLLGNLSEHKKSEHKNWWDS